MDYKDDPFQLDEVAGMTSKLGSSLEIMNDRQENSPCGPYIGPVNQVSVVARKDVGVAGPQAATIDTAAGARLSDLKAATFNKKTADSPQKTVTPPISPSTEADVADKSSSRRLGT